ncbi:MAG: glutamate 5-kinase [Proteobacteria bacterium]|nr:MAG: glutamate 5-kinase [Pseudomonadota bacterium]
MVVAQANVQIASVDNRLWLASGVMDGAARARARCGAARRIVIKVGTRVLVQANGRPDERRFAALVAQIASLHQEGREVLLVSSGAIGAGLEALGLKTRPKLLPELQMAAAVGQGELMQRYSRLFRRRGIHLGQVLLTHEDLQERQRHLNARNTLQRLLAHRIVPVINENDAVAVEEITFGDNDQLAALVAMLVDAELLVLLTSTNGLRAPFVSGGDGALASSKKTRRTRRVPYLPRVGEAELSIAVGKQSVLSSGGMASKLKAAQRAADAGSLVVIADGRKPDALTRVACGEDLGTLIGGAPAAGLDRGRKRWLAFFKRSRGAITIDDGAVRALTEQGKSLLPAGISGVRGSFGRGALVAIEDRKGHVVAQGLVDYGSEQIAKIQGRRSSEIAGLLGRKDYDHVIHRDNMAVLQQRSGKRSRS